MSGSRRKTRDFPQTIGGDLGVALKCASLGASLRVDDPIEAPVVPRAARLLDRAAHAEAPVEDGAEDVERQKRWPRNRLHPLILGCPDPKINPGNKGGIR